MKLCRTVSREMKNMSSRLTTIAMISIGFCTPLWPQIGIEAPMVFDLDDQGIRRPQGIGYHQERGTLFVVSRTEMFELTLDGEMITSFSIEDLTAHATGTTWDPVTGNLLVSEGTSAIHQIDVRGTEPVKSLFVHLTTTQDADGIAVDPDDGTLWAADDDERRIVNFNRQGIELSRFNTRDFLDSFKEPQGLGFFGKDLLIADDGGASHSLYLVTREGHLKQFLLDTKDYGLSDPEGVVSVDDSSICVIGDRDSEMLCFETPEITAQNSLTVPASLGLPNAFVGVAVGNTVSIENEIEILPTGDTILDPIHVPVAANGELWFATEDVPGAQEAELVKIRGEQGPVQGLIMFGDDDLRRVDGIGSRLIEATTLYFPHARYSKSASTILFLVNPRSTNVLTAHVKLFDRSGIELASASLQIPAQGSYCGDLVSLFGLRNLHDGYIEVVGNGDFAGFEILTSPHSISAIRGMEPFGGKLTAPAVHPGGESSTSRLRIVNPGAESVRVRVVARGQQSGIQASSPLWIPARSAVEEDVHDFLDLEAGEFQGYLEVEALPGILLKGSQDSGLLCTLELKEEGGWNSSIVPLSETPRKKTVFLRLLHTDEFEYSQGLTLMNPSASEATVTLRTYSGRGTLGFERALVLGPGEQLSERLDDEVFFGPEFEQTGGYLRVKSTKAIFALTSLRGPGFTSTLEGQEFFD